MQTPGLSASGLRGNSRGDASGPAPRASRAQGTLRAVAGTAVALALTGIAFQGVSMAEVARQLEGLGPYVALVLIPSTLALSAETLAWQRVIAGIGHTIRFGPLLGVRVATEALGSVLPMGAVWSEAAKPPLLARACGAPLSTSLASMVARKYLLLSTQGAYVLIGAVLGHALLASAVQRLGAAGSWSLVAAAIGVVLIAVAELMALGFRKGALFTRAIGAIGRMRWSWMRSRLASLAAQMPNADGGTGRFFQGSARAHTGPFLLCLATWLLEATETWLVLHLLGADVPWGDAVAVEALVVLLRHVLVALPAGLGAQELGYATLLAGAGVGLDLTAAFTVVKRARELVWVAVGVSILGWTGRTGRASPARALSASPGLT